MRRVLPRRALVFAFAAASACAAAASVTACGSASLDSAFRGGDEDASLRRDGGPVEPPDGGSYDAAPPPGPTPSCEDYCDTVMASCTGDHAQYASRESCVAMCRYLPPGAPGETDTNSVACRQAYASSPSQTMPGVYCPLAGPFGGGTCGDRCTAFCTVALAACVADGGQGPYGSYPDCQTACAAFAYRDGGVDGGGEGPDGPASGDTLNCRLFHLREAVVDASACADLAADSGACR